VKISVDANVPARAVLDDEPAQSRAARKLLKETSLIAIQLPCLSELVWMLGQGVKLSKDGVATATGSLMNVGNVVVNRSAAELGLAILEAGRIFLPMARSPTRGPGWAVKHPCPSTSRPSPTWPDRAKPRNS